jgi:hypothetical protein
MVYPYHDVDLYVATWDVKSHSLREGDTNLDPVDEEYLRKIYGSHMKKCWIGDWEEYKKTRTPFIKRDRPNDVFDMNPRAIEHLPIWPDRLLDQWYVVKQAYQLIDKPDDYDALMKARADMIFIKDLPLECDSPDVIHTSSFNFAEGFAMEDKFAWGDPKVMKKYFHLYDSIQKIYDERNEDISHSEHLMYYYLLHWEEGIPVCIHTEYGYGDYSTPFLEDIETHRLEDFIGGWFIGDFNPSLFRTGDFEVCYKHHHKGEDWPVHYHAEGTEYNLLTKGKMKIMGTIIEPGTIFIAYPYEISDAEFLEDCEVLIIKVPSIPGDKYVV